MTPAAFLALVEGTATAGQAPKPAPPPPRVYCALTRGPTAEAFLTFHTSAGKYEAAPHSGVQLIEGDDRGGTFIKLYLSKMAVTITGRQLAPVFEAIRTRTAAHLFVFDGGRHDPPEPGQAIITEFVFAVAGAPPAAKPAA